MTQSQTEGPAAGNLPVALDQPVHTQNTQLLFAGTPGSAPAESKAYKGITWAQMAPTQTLPWSVHISTPAQQLFTKEQTKAYMSDTLHKSKQCAGGKMQFFMSRPPLIWGQTLEFPTFYSIEPDDPTQGGEKKPELLAEVAVSGHVSRRLPSLVKLPCGPADPALQKLWQGEDSEILSKESCCFLSGKPLGHGQQRGPTAPSPGRKGFHLVSEEACWQGG